MAYTSVIPVHRLDRSIEYVKDKEKTTQKADSVSYTHLTLPTTERV